MSPTSDAIILGIVQGITEFLPISSDGHLAITQKLLGQEASLAITVFLHIGTLLATALVLRQKSAALVVDSFRALGAPKTLWSEAGDVRTVLFVTIPTGIIGIALKHSVERWSDDPMVIGACFLLSAAVLVSTRWAKNRELLTTTIGGAVFVGCAQGLAVLPGLSRSALTISSLLWLGLSRQRAFELSFLASLPAVLGAVLLEAPKALKVPGSTGPLLMGVLASFVFGVIALVLLRRILGGNRVWAFSLYLVPLALATLAWGYAAP